VALPESASLATLERPRERALRLAARITSPAAIEHDSYLGGFASGHHLSYSDAKQFVWWGATVPAPVTGGYGRDAYGSGNYGEG
jgi:hypothetical protein